MIVLGVDEAGRGPLAGPLAVGTIAVPDGFDLLGTFPGLNDSKKLSEPKREAIFALLEEQVQRGAVQFHVALISAQAIDADGITKAVYTGVEQGVRALMPDPANAQVLLDGSLKAPPEYQQQTIVKGDATIPAIMLASIAAKVTRDHKMLELDAKFPEYGFAQHKGYGTVAHYDALRKYGPTFEHRKLFLRKFDEQQIKER